MGDDDEDKQPSLTVVSENPNARADRQIEWAKNEAQGALSQFAAALLRAMAGNDTEAAFLVRHLARFIEALSKFRAEADRGLSVAELQEALRLPQAELDAYGDDDWRQRRWLREHGMDVIVKGALRLAAHKVLGEEPAFGGMHSERVIERGIETLEELKRPPPPKPRPRQTKNLAGSRDDFDLGAPTKKLKRRFGERLGPSPAPRASAQRSTSRRAGFDASDLKELRRAIKAKGDKRIAELTAKIGKPPFDK